MKCYFGGSCDPFDHEFTEACFANSRNEAKTVMWTKGELSEACGGEWMDARIIRQPQHDRLVDWNKDDAYIIRDKPTLRKMGWRIEGDQVCDTCGLAEFDGEYPVCEDSGQCSECGGV